MNPGQKYGPYPPRLRPYHPALEGLERQANNTLIGEYKLEVLQTLAQLELALAVNPAMIDLQPEIQWFMRPFLLDFLIELHSLFKLQPATLFLCLNIIDRYCAKRIVFKRHYQLVGCTALWIAGKYEDKKLRVPTLKELTIMCRNAYDEEMFVQMEMHILLTLEWQLSHPNLEECLQLAITHAAIDHLDTPQAPHTPTRKLQTTTLAVTAVGRFLCELSLYNRYFLLVPTSLVAITANLLACLMLQIPRALEAVTDLLRRQRLRMYAHQNFSFEVDNTTFMDEDITDDDSDSELAVPTNTALGDENRVPKVEGAFLSGFDLSQIDTIKQIALQFILQLSKITEVLTKKYEPLGVIQVIQNFNQRFGAILTSITESPPAADAPLSDKHASIADLLLQFPLPDLMLLPLAPSLAHHTPATPPLATSQYLVFSNKRSLTALTPVYSSYNSGLLLGRTRSKISKHKFGHHSATNFAEYLPTTHKFKFSAPDRSFEWSLPITNQYSL